MTFTESLNYLHLALEQDLNNSIYIQNKHLTYSNAFQYIYKNIELIIGVNTHHNIILSGVYYHEGTPMTRCITDNPVLNLSTCIAGHVIFLPQSDKNNFFVFFWHMAHEMVHVFLSIKDNTIPSSYHTPSVLEEGLATYIAEYLYYQYFSNINIYYPPIFNNDFAYNQAENIYKQIMLLNNNDISFIKKIRQINPSLKLLNKNDFQHIIITQQLINESVADFQSKFNRVPGTY